MVPSRIGPVEPRRGETRRTLVTSAKAPRRNTLKPNSGKLIPHQRSAGGSAKVRTKRSIDAHMRSPVRKQCCSRRDPLARLRADWIEKAQHFRTRLGGVLVDPRSAFFPGGSKTGANRPFQLELRQPLGPDRSSRGCSFDGIDEDRIAGRQKIDGFGQRIQFSLRAERAMICSREG